MIEDPRTAEKSGKNDFAPDSLARTVRHQIVGHDAQYRSQLENIPSAPAQNGHARAVPHDRIAFPRDRLDECGFAAAIRPQDGYMFACIYAQAEVIKRNIFA